MCTKREIITSTLNLDESFTLTIGDKSMLVKEKSQLLLRRPVYTEFNEYDMAVATVEPRNEVSWVVRIGHVHVCDVGPAGDMIAPLILHRDETKSPRFTVQMLPEYIHWYDPAPVQELYVGLTNTLV